MEGLRCLPCDKVYDAGSACPTCGTPLTRRAPLAEEVDLGEADATAAVARRITKYVVMEFVARGAMGAVYKALHPGLGRAIALKILNETRSTPAFLERFRTEALAAARLSHPNIVRVHDAGSEGGLHYVAMELVEGRSLEEMLEGPRDVRRLLSMLEKIARAVHHAHEQGVVHRDLKPSNVLVRTDGEPFVADFGLARLTDQQGGVTKAGARLGTPYYMAPEQVAGSPAGPAADVYALGVILYRILTGRHPHEGPTLEAVYHAIATASAPAPRRHNPAVNRDVEVICLKSLERAPKHRYATANELADDLARYLGGEAILARAASLPVRAWRRARRHPAVAVALLLAAVCAVSLSSYAAAIRAWRAEQAAALDDMRQTATSLVELALSLRRNGQLAAMRPVREMLAKTYAQVSARAPGLPEVDYWMGRMHRALMEDDEALRYQEKALSKDPEFAPSLYERAVLHSLKYRDGLREAERRWRARSPREAGRGDLEDSALAALRESVVRDAGALKASALVREPMVLAAQGIAARRLDGGGADLLRDALRRDPLLEEAYEALAEAGPLDEREWCYEEAIERDRGYLRHWLGLGDVRVRRGDNTRAVEAYSRAIALDGACVEAWLGRGQARMRAGAAVVESGADPRKELAEAEEDYREAARRKPEGAEAHLGLGLVESTRALYVKDAGGDPLEAWARAEEHFERAAVRDSRTGDPWLMRGIVRTNRGLHRAHAGGDPAEDYAAAEQDLTRALELDVRDADARLARGKLRMNAAAQQLAAGAAPDYGGAESDLEAALALAPSNADAWLARGLVETGRGAAAVRGGGDGRPHWTLAVEHFTRAIEANGRQAEAYLRRGTVRSLLAGTGDRALLDEAVKDWEEAIRLNPILEPQIRERLQRAKR